MIIASNVYDNLNDHCRFQEYQYIYSSLHYFYFDYLSSHFFTPFKIHLPYPSFRISVNSKRGEPDELYIIKLPRKDQ